MATVQVQQRQARGQARAGPAASPRGKRQDAFKFYEDIDYLLTGKLDELPENAEFSLLEANDLVVAALRNRYDFPRSAEWYILNPYSLLRPYWDGFIFLSLLYIAIVSPFEVAFLPDDTTVNTLFILDRCVDVTFIMDFVMNMFLGSFDDSRGLWRVTLPAIWSTYIRSWFLIDLISAIPFDLISLFIKKQAVHGIAALRIIRVLRLIKLIRLLKSARLLSRWNNRVNISYNAKEAVKMLLLLATTAHWMACAIRLVVELENVDFTIGDNWITAAIHSFGGSIGDHATLYIMALEWSSQTVLGLGYGDFPLKTEPERLVGSLCMILGVAVFAYALGNITAIVAEIDREGSSHNALMDDLYAFTRASGLPLSLNTSVKTFFRNSRRIRAERRYQFLLDHMSPGLRSAVMAETYELWLCAVPFFDFKRNTVRGQRPEITAAVEKEGHEFMRALAAAVELLAFPPLEAILWPHQETSAMYIIRDGLASSRGKTLGKGDYFGHEMILDGYRRGSGVTSLTFLDTFCIRKSAMTSLIDSGAFPFASRHIRRYVLYYTLRYRFPVYVKAVNAFQRKHPLQPVAADVDATDVVSALFATPAKGPPGPSQVCYQSGPTASRLNNALTTSRQLAREQEEARVLLAASRTLAQLRVKVDTITTALTAER